jgi:hypothetical protein
MIENICIGIMIVCAAGEFLYMIIDGVMKLIVAAREHGAPKKESQLELGTL